MTHESSINNQSLFAFQLFLGVEPTVKYPQLIEQDEQDDEDACFGMFMSTSKNNLFQIRCGKNRVDGFVKKLTEMGVCVQTRKHQGVLGCFWSIEFEYDLNNYSSWLRKQTLLSVLESNT